MKHLLVEAIVVLDNHYGITRCAEDTSGRQPRHHYGAAEHDRTISDLRTESWDVFENSN